MVDSIQSTSVVPLPANQAGRAVVDPLPIGSAADQQQVAKAKDATDDGIRQADFDAYREQRGPTLLRQNGSGPIFDPAREIEQASIYRGLGT